MKCALGAATALWHTVQRAHDAMGTNGPQVTVLLPVKHYHRRFLEEAIRSILHQSVPEWRLLVIVEDATGPRLPLAVQAAAADRRVAVVRNDGRKLAGAINTGMRYAATDYVAILLGDDHWALDAVEVLERCITREPEVDFFHSSRQVVDEEGRPISSILRSRDAFAASDFKNGSPVKHLLCWRRQMGLAVGGLDESLNSVGPDDYDFPWTMADHGARFRAVPECLYYYRDHRECYRLTTHLPLHVHRAEINRIMKKHGVARPERRERLARVTRSFLRQCLFRSYVDKWIKELRGYDARQGWRERYR